MATKDNTAFLQAHPELAERFREEGLDWLNKYTDYKNGKVNEQWERDANGTLVDVTAREKAYGKIYGVDNQTAYQEIEDAKEELERLHRKELNEATDSLTIRGKVRYGDGR